MVTIRLLNFHTKLVRSGQASLARKFAKQIKLSKLKARDFEDKYGNNVVSDDLLEAHIGLYEGYVKAYNTILTKLEETKTKDNGYSYGEFSELKRRLAVPYNAAMFHELYFEHLKPEEVHPASGELKDLIVDRWGSVNKYLDDVKSTALGTGNGWVVTFYHPDRGLENAMITEHHIGLLVGQVPIMVLDTWEHAFVLDYSTNRAEYVEKFLEELDFEVLARRLPNYKAEPEESTEAVEPENE